MNTERLNEAQQALTDFIETVSGQEIEVAKCQCNALVFSSGHAQTHIDAETMPFIKPTLNDLHNCNACINDAPLFGAEPEEIEEIESSDTIEMLPTENSFPHDKVTVFVVEDLEGEFWYSVKGSQTIFKTDECPQDDGIMRELEQTAEFNLSESVINTESDLEEKVLYLLNNN